MVLGAIAAHDVGVAPVVVVGEQQRLAEQGRPQFSLRSYVCGRDSDLTLQRKL